MPYIEYVCRYVCALGNALVSFTVEINLFSLANNHGSVHEIQRHKAMEKSSKRKDE